ncbi:hypothetical protein VNO80_13037 [Phaseolus coccineus]|uniref:Leucine-rich repeat-containing N-terminal plant-type domain-containing protein n=1 Tax=Phaseolus coccineus TaxID=3886 RepID=A0AAN9N137_PHACN
MPKLFALAQAHAICVAYWPMLFTSVTGPCYLRQLSPRKSGRICVRFCVHALLRVASTLRGSSPRNLRPTLKPKLILICFQGFFVGCLAGTKQTHKRPFSNFCVVHGQHQIRCLPKEREALLQFKSAIIDSYDMLSSWSTPNCCQWEGICCSNLTTHILGLHLPGQHYIEYHYEEISKRYITGEIHESLMELRQLEHNSLEGDVSQLGNLSQLQELYLGGCNDFRGCYGTLKINEGGQWLSNLISLTHLSLKHISNFNTSPSYFQMIAKLPKLRELSLIDCGLSNNFLLSFKPSNFNFSTSLSVLDLSRNSFTQAMIFKWVSNTTSNLVEFYLWSNLLEGSTSNHYGLAMNSLQHLDLSYNVFKGEDLKSFMNTCTLCFLDMSGNKIVEDLPSILRGLSSGCLRYSLQELHLSYNQITGSIPDLSIFSSLKSLDLSGNQLSGKIPQDTRWPSQLEHLSTGSNSVKESVPMSFESTCNLESLDLSDNKLNEDLTVVFNHLSRCCRYSLRELYLGRNKFNCALPDFSMFLKLEVLDVLRNQLKDGVPKSLHNATILLILDLSNNSLSENLPTIIHHLSQYVRYSLQHLDLSQNQITGTLPNTFTMFPSLKGLYLNSNKLNGTISEDLRFPTQLEELSLMSNSLKGVIKDSHFSNMSKLETLELLDNSIVLKFSQNRAPSFQLGYIGLRSCNVGPLFPKWIQSQNKIRFLDISNNGISNTLPIWFWDKFELRNPISINISYDNLEGMIPNLSLENSFDSFDLGSNQFEGPIPSFIRDSTYIDLSNNKFTDSFWFLCSSGEIGLGANY